MRGALGELVVKGDELVRGGLVGREDVGGHLGARRGALASVEAREAQGSHGPGEVLAGVGAAKVAQEHGAVAFGRTQEGVAARVHPGCEVVGPRRSPGGGRGDDEGEEGHVGEHVCVVEEGRNFHACAKKCDMTDDEIQGVANDTFKIQGVGRCFSRGIPTGECFRTGCIIHLAAPIRTVHETLRRNLVHDAASHAQCTVRLMVQGTRYWYRTDAAEAVFEDTVCIAASPLEARARRRSDRECTTAVPAQVCLLEEEVVDDEGTQRMTTLVTWLFRHDVLDGWRCLRYLGPLVFEQSVHTADRLRERFLLQEKQRKRGYGSLALNALATALLAPAATLRLWSLRERSSPPNHPPPRLTVTTAQCYLHASVSVETLKNLAQSQNLGTMSQALTCVLVAALFEADPDRQSATVATNQLFDMDATVGNHVCVKAARVPRDTGDTTPEGRMRTTARTLRAPAQQLADVCVTHVSRAYTLGRFPALVDRFVEARHRSLDLLVSNLPAFDSTVPAVRDVQVARDFASWTPSIVYAVGVGERIFLNAYFAPQGPAFDVHRFARALVDVAGAKDVHMRLPRCYRAAEKLSSG